MVKSRCHLHCRVAWCSPVITPVPICQTLLGKQGHQCCVQKRHLLAKEDVYRKNQIVLVWRLVATVIFMLSSCTSKNLLPQLMRCRLVGIDWRFKLAGCAKIPNLESIMKSKEEEEFLWISLLFLGQNLLRRVRTREPSPNSRKYWVPSLESERVIPLNSIVKVKELRLERNSE